MTAKPRTPRTLTNGQLAALIHERGGAITVRQLQQARACYRHSAVAASDALERLVTAGLGTWQDHRTLRLTGQQPPQPPPQPQPLPLQAPTPPKSTVTKPAPKIRTKRTKSSQPQPPTPPITAPLLPVTPPTAAAVTLITETTNGEGAEASSNSPVTAKCGGGAGVGGVTAGNVAAPVAVVAEGTETEATREETWAHAAGRWTREGRRRDADGFRETVRMECIAQGLTKSEAKQHSWKAAIAAFPPGGRAVVDLPIAPPEPEQKAPEPPNGNSNGHLKGLGELPPGWPPLPPNANLQTEIGWVQAQRLTLVDEEPGGATAVHLDRATEPAPSMAALGWLETSIRSYAKYVDVVARSLATAQDEQEHTRRERIALDEVQALVGEMVG